MSTRFQIIFLCAAAAIWPALAMAQMAPASGRSSPADQSFADGMTTMNDGMAAAPMTGNADQDFVAMMLPHHQGAVAMAKAELQYGTDPQLRELARDIIAAQDKEIAQMQAWQAKHATK
jgi:uncharacterized protein (DUF305 family)